MRPQRLALLPLAITGFAFSACQVEAGLTASGDSIAEAAADALEQEIGERPEVDCGDDDIIIDSGKEVDCVVTDPATEADYDATVTLEVIGDQEGWRVRVDVADEPSGESPAASASPTETQAPEEPQDDPTGQVAASEVEAAIADALEAQIGQRPSIDCGEVDVNLWEGRALYCWLTDEATGDQYEVKATFNGVSNGQWTFDIEVADTPR